MLPLQQTSAFRSGHGGIAMHPAGPSVGSLRRRQEGWDAASILLYCFLLVTSFSIWVTCRRGLSGPTAFHGQVLGVFCGALAVLGWVCAGLPLPLSHQCTSTSQRKRMQRVMMALSLPLRTALLVGLALGALGTVGLMDQVASDVGMHCMMAEAAVRIAHLEETVTKIRHDELLTQVFFRLQELDDLMHEASEGHTTHLELKSKAFQLQDQDRDLIRERVDRLARHSTSLLAETRKQLAAAHTAKEEAQKNLTAAMSADQPKARTFAELEMKNRRMEQLENDKKQKEEMVSYLEQRAEAVESVLHYIETRSHDAHAALTFEEYQLVLDALLQGTAPPPGSASAPDGPHSQVHVHSNQPNTGGWFPAAGQQESVTDQFTLTPPISALRDALSKDQESLETARAAFDRRSTNAYESTLSHSQHIPKQVAEKRAAARKEFEARFTTTYHTAVTGHLHPDTYRDSLVTALDNLPSHCLKDEVAFVRLRWLSAAMAVLLALSGYTTCTALMGKLVNAVKDL